MWLTRQTLKELKNVRLAVAAAGQVDSLPGIQSKLRGKPYDKKSNYTEQRVLLATKGQNLF